MSNENDPIDILLSFKEPSSSDDEMIVSPVLKPQSSDTMEVPPPMSILENPDTSVDSEINPIPQVYSPRKCVHPNCIVCFRGTPSIVEKCPTWSTIMRVVFYSLNISYPEKKFFNLRTDVYTWMIQHWFLLCRYSKDISDNWKKQVQDMLSHSKNLFESGADYFRQNGFWRLKPCMDSDPWSIKKPYRDRSKIPQSPTPRETNVRRIKATTRELKNYIMKNDLLVKKKMKQILEDMYNISSLIEKVSQTVIETPPSSPTNAPSSPSSFTIDPPSPQVVPDVLSSQTEKKSQLSHILSENN